MLKLILYYSQHGKGYGTTVIDKNVDATGNAFGRKRHKIPSDFILTIFRKVNQLVLNRIHTSGRRIYAIDGSKSSMVTQNSKEPCVGLLISTLFDVRTNIAIDVTLVSHYNEREAILDSHLQFIEPGSIVLMDRGYFSDQLLLALHNKGIKVIFRMKIDSILVQDLLNNSPIPAPVLALHNSRERKISKIVHSIKLYLYNCKDVIPASKSNQEYIYSSNIDTSVEDIQKLYQKRWTIETYYGHLKYSFQDNVFQTPSLEYCKQALYLQYLVLSIARVLESIIIENCFYLTNVVKIESNLIYKENCSKPARVKFCNLVSNVNSKFDQIISLLLSLDQKSKHMIALELFKVFEPIISNSMKQMRYVDLYKQNEVRKPKRKKAKGTKKSLSTFLKEIKNKEGDYNVRTVRSRSFSKRTFLCNLNLI
jgi:hypothetical protein